MVTANKLIHLMEAFSTPWFLFSSPTNHHLVFFLLEMFNNIIQYQFDGKIFIKLKLKNKYTANRFKVLSLAYLVKALTQVKNSLLIKTL